MTRKWLNKLEVSRFTRVQRHSFSSVGIQRSARMKKGFCRHSYNAAGNKCQSNENPIMSLVLNVNGTQLLGGSLQQKSIVLAQREQSGCAHERIELNF